MRLPHQLSPLPWQHLRLARLPPVGQALCVQTPGPAPTAPPGFSLLLTQSGTAALALALLLARLRKDVQGEPEVLLPGYACPDLLAAAHWAGVRPILVDLEANDTGLDNVDLLRRCSARTVAIVAVNFLGIADDLIRLRSTADAMNALLIEDNAQYFPEPLEAAALSGDCVVLSFGRGKPVPLVGGGALLVRSETPDNLQSLLPALAPDHSRRWLTEAKLHAYNLALHPLVYGLLARLPIGLGRTRYKPLQAVRQIDQCRSSQLASNIAWQSARVRDVEQQIRSRVISQLPTGSIDLATAAGVRTKRLLRYPILLPDRVRRDALLEQLTQDGLGATSLYGKVLPEVEGVDADVYNPPLYDSPLRQSPISQPPLTNARRFAERLLTLPVHAGVKAEHIERMAKLARGA